MAKYKTHNKHNTVIAKAKNEFYALNYTFKSENSDLQGAVGTVFRAVTETEHADRLTEWENYDPELHPLGHVWKQQVQDGETTASFEQFVKQIPEWERDELMYDMSGSRKQREEVKNLSEHDEEDIYIVECIAGGRCIDSMIGNFDEVFKPELIEEVKKFEGEE